MRHSHIKPLGSRTKKGPQGEEQSLEQSGLAGWEDKLQLHRSVERGVFLGHSQKHLEEGTFVWAVPSLGILFLLPLPKSLFFQAGWDGFSSCKKFRTTAAHHRFALTSPPGALVCSAFGITQCYSSAVLTFTTGKERPLHLQQE